ncbi:MAG: hypothetical protein EP344_17025 [Bacteroidetes bacterium]|nr:MAG: hypothetical protein EP344_17025 [Bacteroidota bacterium]
MLVIFFLQLEFSLQPSNHPTIQPSNHPTIQPSNHLTIQHRHQSS